MKRMNFSFPGVSEQSFDPAAFGKMKADTINRTAGDLTGYDCPECLNRGYVAAAREDGAMFMQECGCMRIRRCIWKMEASGLKNVIREKTFDTYRDAEPWQTAIKQGAKAYADKPEGWLLFCGQSGSGKTHLCTAVCRHRLLAGDEVRYMPWRDDVTVLKSMSLDSEKRQEIIDGLKKAQILYIDDLYKIGRAADGSNNPTGADVSLAFELLNYRYNNRLLTIISTEKTPEELVKIDEATGSRIVEMAAGRIYSIKRDISRNYRLRGVVAV